MINLKWMKCGSDNHYCSLENLRLEGVNEVGVYVIWHEGDPSRVVRIGQGDVGDRLSRHRNDAQILAYKKYGTLRVTWAAVPAQYLNGVERYLADQWNPLVGDAFPVAVPVQVNSPFA